MYRKDREIQDKTFIDEIINEAAICRIGMCDGEIPYVIPVNFGFDDNIIYFHCAPEGKKLDILKKNNNICFEVETGFKIQKNKIACSWSVKYKSVVGNGKAYLIENHEEKLEALRIIMRHYSEEEFNFPDVQKTTLVKIIISSFSGKQSGYGQ